MELITFYIIASYIIHMGMILAEFEKAKQVPTLVKVSLIFAPFTILLIIGMMLSNNNKLL